MSEVLESRAAAVIEANKYMTLATVDGDGRPWATPVYFTPDGHTDFYWVSSPAAEHSRNIESNPEITIVIFDSSVPIGGAQAVYLSAHAHLVPDEDLTRCAELYSGRYPELRGYGADDLRDEIRLYRATATKAWILVRGSDPDYGTGIDSRRPIWSD